MKINNLSLETNPNLLNNQKVVCLVQLYHSPRKILKVSQKKNKKRVSQEPIFLDQAQLRLPMAINHLSLNLPNLSQARNSSEEAPLIN